MEIWATVSGMAIPMALPYAKAGLDRLVKRMRACLGGKLKKRVKGKRLQKKQKGGKQKGNRGLGMVVSRFQHTYYCN